MRWYASASCYHLDQHTRDVNTYVLYFRAAVRNGTAAVIARYRGISRVVSWSPKSTGTATTMQILSLQRLKTGLLLGVMLPHITSDGLTKMHCNPASTTLAETALDATSNTLLEHIDARMDRPPSTAHIPQDK